ncbi:MAG: hypothetical protein IGBAC_1194 [Ignavibacteriae bacterium]|nr:MAG: hypothetical protein IGBAC_1194 [Ignavibacteriota bacterium]
MQNSAQISNFYQELKNRINVVRKKQNSINIIDGILKFFILSLVLVAFLSLLNVIFQFNVAGRTILFYTFIFIQLCSSSLFILIPILKKFGLLKYEDDYQIAIKIGKNFPDIHDRLLNTIQIYEHKEKELKNSKFPIYSYELIDAAFKDFFEEIKSIDFLKALDYRRVNLSKRGLFYISLFILMIVIIMPEKMSNSVYQLLRYNVNFIKPPEINLFVTPGNSEAVKGENVTITINANGAPVKNLTLNLRQEGVIKFEPIVLKPASMNYETNEYFFHHTIPNIKSSLEYFVEALDVKTENYKITVLDRPIIKSLQLTLDYPSYTKLSQRKLEENIGDVMALPGTIINYAILSSKNITSAELIFEDSSIVKFSVNENSAQSRIRLTKETSYKIILRDENNLTNADPITYQLKIIPDEYPSVSILVPGKNIDVSESMLLNMLLKIKDDYGFTKMQLAYRLVQSKYEMPQENFSFIDIQLPTKDQLNQEFWYDWNLAGLRLVPEDVVAYYVEVFDNDFVSGPKSTKSETYLIRLPSLEEVFADVAENQKQTIESMQNAVKEAEQLKKQLDELEREVKKNPQKLDWQQQKKIEDITKKYENLRKNITEAAKKVEEMIQKMDDNKLLSQQTLEKYLELQKLMEELKNPELQEALKKLQERMQQMSPEQMKQALQQMNFSEEDFKKNLERTLELLKRIHIEQKVDELIKRTEELIKQQKALQQEVSNTNSQDKDKLESLLKQQENIKEQIDKLQEETKKLKEKMSEFPEDMPLDKINSAEKNLTQKQLQQKSQKSSRQMMAGQMKEASQTQSEMADDLQDFLEQMQDVQKSMQEQMQREVLNKMRKVVQDLIETSQQQEELKQDTKNLDPNSQRFRENTQKQFGLLENLTSIANSMAEISKKSFAISPEMGKEIGNAMRGMGEAIQNMEQRNPFASSQKQTEAMSSINRAAMMMQNAISAMKKGGGKGMGMASLMQRLGQMAGIQAGINAQTAEAMGQGQGLTPQQMAEYARLAGQQAALQKSLEQLAKEAKDMGEFSKLLGDLDRIAKDMAEVQTDLEQGDVNPETLKKQERILSRLLDSQRSMRERDYEKRRRAEVAKDYKHISPADIDLTNQESKNRLREELLKVLEEKYSKDYEELIRKYFEELEKIENW